MILFVATVGLLCISLCLCSPRGIWTCPYLHISSSVDRTDNNRIHNVSFCNTGRAWNVRAGCLPLLSCPPLPSRRNHTISHWETSAYHELHILPYNECAQSSVICHSGLTSKASLASSSPALAPSPVPSANARSISYVDRAAANRLAANLGATILDSSSAVYNRQTPTAAAPKVTPHQLSPCL